MSNENGLRIGAASNQASTIVAAMLTAGLIGTIDIPDFHRDILETCLSNMEKVQSQIENPNGGRIAPAPAVTPVAVFNAEASMAEAFPTGEAPSPVLVTAGAPAAAGYNTAFSGSSKPLDVASLAATDGWLVAQCQALGIDKVWDNRGKPNYISAINEGKEKTPPPFRSATEGIEKSLWPK
jgi:hypothetical protein